jgi:hypothetical protein
MMNFAPIEFYRARHERAKAVCFAGYNKNDAGPLLPEVVFSWAELFSCLSLPRNPSALLRMALLRVGQEVSSFAQIPYLARR